MNVFHSALGLVLFLALAAFADDAKHDPVVLVIHGGAGVIPKKEMEKTPKLREQYEAALKLALETGHSKWKVGTSLDAVEAAIKVMEDSPLFNAGKGAVFTNEGRNELDASIMEGEHKNAGAVAGVTIVKNPISAARAVMEKSPHVMMVGRGAETFAREQGLKIVNPLYFWTPERFNALLKAQKEEEKEKQQKGKKGGAWQPPLNRYFGTVGAVAVKRGHIAAGTSTGGMTNKRFGRVGDSPIIGAGTYADNATCGVSCTGHGEVFIRFGVAKDVVARMKYSKQFSGKDLSVKDAAEQTLASLPNDVGGLIALDKEGKVAMPFNTEGMYRGTITATGVIEVMIYKGKEK